MKKTIKNFYNSNEKNNLKLIKKMFGCNSLEEVIKLEDSIREELESTLKKEIDLIDPSQIKGNSYLMYNYAKYKTLKIIIDLWIENRKLYAFGNDYLEVSK